MKYISILCSMFFLNLNASLPQACPKPSTPVTVRIDAPSTESTPLIGAVQPALYDPSQGLSITQRIRGGLEPVTTKLLTAALIAATICLFCPDPDKDYNA